MRVMVILEILLVFIVSSLYSQTSANLIPPNNSGTVMVAGTAKAQELLVALAREKGKLDSLNKLKEKHAKKYFNDVIYPQLCKNLLTTILIHGEETVENIGISENTDPMIFFAEKPKYSKEEIIEKVEQKFYDEVKSVENKSIEELNSKYPKYKVGERINIATRTGMKYGIIKKIDDTSVYLDRARVVLREDIAPKERIRFFEKDRKEYLRKSNVRMKRELNDTKIQDKKKLYYSSGYLPVNNDNQLDFSNKAVGWFTREEVLKEEIKRNDSKSALKISEDFEANKYALLVFDTIKQYEEWCSIVSEQLLELGRRYYYGKGINRDNLKAYDCFCMGKELGNAEATVNVGLCYDEGVGIKKNKSLALQNFIKAAKMGSAKGMYFLGIYYYNGYCTKVDKKKAVKLWEEAGAMGHAFSLLQLGILYDNGNGEEVFKNKQKAFSYFSQAAQIGQPLAQFNVAACYEFGNGVELNYKLALEWYAAVQNNVHADDELIKRAKDAYGDVFTKSLSPKDSYVFFLKASAHTFNKFPKFITDLKLLAFAYSLSTYSKKHLDDFSKEVISKL